MRIITIILTFFLSALTLTGSAQSRYIDDPGVSNKYMLDRINQIRTNGCRCGGKRLAPVAPLKWNKTLAHSAYTYAKHMYTHQIFSHHSIDGKDIGDRLDDLGYNWQHVGENLAEGQRKFDIAVKEWIESQSHCEMLMNPDMTEMGLAKFGRYWVHHLGAPMPQNKRRVSKTYRQGE